MMFWGISCNLISVIQVYVHNHIEKKWDYMSYEIVLFKNIFNVMYTAGPNIHKRYLKMSLHYLTNKHLYFEEIKHVSFLIKHFAWLWLFLKC